MENICINTTLMAGPCPKRHEILVVTRGATAGFDFDLSNKVYTFADMDQFTVLFKQNKNLFRYEALEYFTPTTDSVAQAGTTYYERLEANRVSLYKFVEKNVIVGQSVNGLFVRYELPDGVSTDNWQLNDHFNVSDDYKLINLMLDSKETEQFKKTCGNYVLLETAARLNTDILAGMHNKDSIIIDRWHGIEVIDSLYSSNSSNASGMVCSDDLVCE